MCCNVDQRKKALNIFQYNINIGESAFGKSKQPVYLDNN